MVKRTRGLRPIGVLPIGFLIIILMGSLLLMTPAATNGVETLSFSDALFTATSASCVTGLIVRDTGTFFSPFGQVVIIVLIQLGGLGFMTMSTILFSMTRRRVSMFERMSMAEGLGEDRLQGVVKLCRGAVLVTGVCEGAGALMLAVRFIPQFGWQQGIWKAVFTSISAFCNAGFDLMGRYSSLTDYATDPYVLCIIMALIVVGGLGFAVVLSLFDPKRRRRPTLHCKLVLIGTAGLLVGGTALILLLEYGNPATLGTMPFGEKLLNAAFESVTLRTAGFNSIDQYAMHDATKGVGILLMLAGGAPAGTAGGLKVTTIITLALAVWAYLRGRGRTAALGRSIPYEQIRKAMTLFFCGTLYLIAMTIVISAIEQFKQGGAFSFWNLLFEATSAFCTVGLTVGATAKVTVASRMILASMMYVGRVGLLTVAMSLTDDNRQTALIDYPEESVLIG